VCPAQPAAFVETKNKHRIERRREEEVGNNKY
jgi:hypothetical protein